MRPILALKVSGVLGTLIVCLAMPAGSFAQTVDVSGRYRCAQASTWRSKCGAASYSLVRRFGNSVAYFQNAC